MQRKTVERNAPHFRRTVTVIFAPASCYMVPELPACWISNPQISSNRFGFSVATTPAPTPCIVSITSGSASPALNTARRVICGT